MNLYGYEDEIDEYNVIIILGWFGMILEVLFQVI